MQYRQTTYQSVTGKTSLIELSDSTYGEWIVYENGNPKYHIQSFDDQELSNMVIRALLNSGKTITEIIDIINKKNGTEFFLRKKPAISVVEKSELIDLHLEPNTKPINQKHRIMQLLDGKYVSEKLKGEIAEQAAQYLAKSGRQPHLVAVLVGHDGGSETYVASKMKNCEKVGFKSTLVRYEDTVTEEELLAKVAELNANEDIDGIIVQLPLPKHIDPEKVTEQIDHRKDVDGFHPINLGRMQRNLPSFIPATPYGITLMLKEYGIETAGKHCVVVGRSNIVGSPMSILMARNTQPGNCTVTICHSRTPDIKKFTLDADILIVAIGKKNFITADMVKEGAVVVDVGMNRETSTTTKSGYKLYGDVDFENVAPKASWITPVPGGVGLMTIIGLLRNTLASANGEVY